MTFPCSGLLLFKRKDKQKDKTKTHLLFHRFHGSEEAQASVIWSSVQGLVYFYLITTFLCLFIRIYSFPFLETSCSISLAHFPISSFSY